MMGTWGDIDAADTGLRSVAPRRPDIGCYCHNPGHHNTGAAAAAIGVSGDNIRDFKTALEDGNKSKKLFTDFITLIIIHLSMTFVHL